MMSSSNEFFFIIDLSIESIEIFYQHIASEWESWLNIIRILRGNLGIEFFPFLIKIISIFWSLHYCMNFLLLWVHLESFIESNRINFFQNCLQSNQRLLKNFVPMILSKFNNDWNKHWECFLFVSFKDI